MSNSAALTISVIVPVHNGGVSFLQCLSSLNKAIDINKVIVVADGDQDGSSHIAEEFGAKVLRIHPSGPAKARNIGASFAQSDILLFVDADVAIKPNTITQVLQVFQQEPDLAALIGSYDDEPGASNFLSQYKNLFNHYIHQTAKEEAFTFWGACGAIRRDVFLSVGGFDESYLSMEDVELGCRLKQAGYRIRLCKDLQVKHLKHWAVVSLLRAEFFHRALPWTKLILRDRMIKNDLNLGISSRLSVILIYGLLITVVHAWWWKEWLALALVLSLLLLAINTPVYRFFWHKRGFWFALGVIPWHWFYYLYGGLAFAIGTIQYFFRDCWSPKTKVFATFK